MINGSNVYLDNNATTKIDSRVLDMMIPYYTEYFANANSPHIAGISVKEAVEKAAWQIADLIGAKGTEIIFTSGATEALNIAIKGFNCSLRNRIVTFQTEHNAVLDTCRYMESGGVKVDYLPVRKDGSIDIEQLDQFVTEETLMVVVMMSNNETGTLHNISEISKIVRKRGALMLCDTTQAVGKIPINVQDLGIDMMTVSAHKIYGPKGVGALYISDKAKIKISAQTHGGGQQNNLRSGTLNVPGIIGMGKACDIASSEMQRDEIRTGKLRDHLEKELLQIEGSFVNGTVENRIYNTSNICFPGVWSEQLILALGDISVSSGSACSSVTSRPSHVLKALGLSDKDALSSIRFSLGRFTTFAEVDFAAKKIQNIVNQLRS